MSGTAALTPAMAARQFSDKLTFYEKTEIESYPEVFYVGQSCGEKVKAPTSGFNDGYDTENGEYTIAPADHIAYRYEIEKILGTGAFGQVVQAIDHSNGTTVAVKLIRNKPKVAAQAQTEINILAHINEKDPFSKYGIVRMHTHFLFRRHVCIVYELLGTNLYDNMEKTDFYPMQLSMVRKLAARVLVSLTFLWKESIIHCDLKPENILYATSEVSDMVKVADLGSACYDSKVAYTYIQSRFYRAPEVIFGLRYGRQIDLWSFGCILCELATGYPLFPGETERDQLACIMEFMGKPPASLVEKSKKKRLYFDENNEPVITANSRGKIRTPNAKTLPTFLGVQADHEFVSFIEQLLQWDPADRVPPREAMKHPWIREEFIFTVPVNKPAAPVAADPPSARNGAPAPSDPLGGHSSSPPPSRPARPGETYASVVAPRALTNHTSHSSNASNASHLSTDTSLEEPLQISRVPPRRMRLHVNLINGVASATVHSAPAAPTVPAVAVMSRSVGPPLILVPAQGQGIAAGPSSALGTPSSQKRVQRAMLTFEPRETSEQIESNRELSSSGRSAIASEHLSSSGLAPALTLAPTPAAPPQPPARQVGRPGPMVATAMFALYGESRPPAQRATRPANLAQRVAVGRGGSSASTPVAGSGRNHTAAPQQQDTFLVNARTGMPVISPSTPTTPPSRFRNGSLPQQGTNAFCGNGTPSYAAGRSERANTANVRDGGAGGGDMQAMQRIQCAFPPISNGRPPPSTSSSTVLLNSGRGVPSSPDPLSGSSKNDSPLVGQPRNHPVSRHPPPHNRREQTITSAIPDNAAGARTFPPI